MSSEENKSMYEHCKWCRHLRTDNIYNDNGHVITANACDLGLDYDKDCHGEHEEQPEKNAMFMDYELLGPDRFNGLMDYLKILGHLRTNMSSSDLKNYLNSRIALVEDEIEKMLGCEK